MKLITYVINCFLPLVCITTVAMEPALIYKKATQSDVNSLLKVIDEQAINDSTKIVILPKKFRQGALEGDIVKNRLYCVTKEGSDGIIAFKKLFIINDENEYDDITQNEIRCHDKNSMMPSFTFKDSVSIYFGGDYTVPHYRHQGINSRLIRHTLEDIKDDVIKAVQTKKAHNIVLLYGLTKANSGETSDGIDRTPSIIRAFRAFAQQVAIECNCNEDIDLYHSRYQAFMPTFDPEDSECKPLPDDQSIPGYGNVLLFSFIKK